METEKQGGFVMKIILDLDTGIDDALALSYALGDPMAEVIGVKIGRAHV